MIITITGPSCSGKSTLQAQLVETYGATPIPTVTTRPPRKGEPINAMRFVTDDQKARQAPSFREGKDSASPVGD
ncbi:hypothetical protein [Thiolapillus sp.]|uniref:hypothetical protein n=1 Tax=Thiolapillus sp. TaxID=2017437 RepID=UPI0025F67A21|nr:hypothetical protein [Thiolapillus sp.]